MHTRTASVAITATLALAATLTGCSDTPAKDAPPPASSKRRATQQATPTSEAKSDGPRAFGKALAWSRDEGSGTTNVLSYRQPFPGVQPPTTTGATDEEWGALEAKVCTKNGKVGVTQRPWSVAYADGARVTTTGQSGGDFPRPEYPQEAMVSPGDCVRGLLMFPVPKGKRPERVIYTPDGSDPAEWKIPAK
ncbi:hypothetical protein [Streptomyces sioyaensis]|uniref:hypothetical protein n=1 Tax=Streptomyces sioyaensis TaxID=67364 RepID=UPI003794175C